ncbi:MAG: hypothetical protein IPL46_06430 [Saprospiraceae bacterium]|nr:hypothetical protein [Saprospiraceae bacterium]
MFPEEAFKVWAFEPDLNRTYTGTSNNLYNPDWGASGARVMNITASEFFDGVAQPSGPDRPNARTISNEIFAQTESIHDVLNLSAYAWGWGQFIDHDITLSPDHVSERLDISIPAFDAYFDPTGTGQKLMPMFRSDYVKGTGTSRANPRAYYNGITAYIDGSAVYGSDEQRAFWLRSFKDGKLKVSTGDLLPYNTLTGEAFDPKDPSAPEMAMPFPNVDRFLLLVT